MENNKKTIHRRIVACCIAIVIIALLLIIGLSRAWFVNDANLVTLVAVKEPSPISIRGPHGRELINMDLSYEDNEKAADGTVTIKRVVSVSSDYQRHKLEIVHTTNLENLSFKLYKAEEIQEGEISQDGYTYKYNSTPIEGSYINESTGNSSNYKYANDSKHSKHFESSDSVQVHAEPLYWLVNGDLASETRATDNTEVDKAYLTYYVLEISWKADLKETDMFYLLAENVV